MTDAVVWTWPSIIDALDGTGAVAEALDEAPSTVSGWRTRGIPGLRWAGVARLAAEKGKPEISVEVLAELAERRLAEVRA